MFLKFSLNILLCILVKTMAFATNCLIPLHYNLSLKLESREITTLKGVSSIIVYNNCPTYTIALDVSNFITILDIHLKSAKSGKIYTCYHINVEINKIMVFISVPLAPYKLESEIYIVNIEFVNNLVARPNIPLYIWYKNAFSRASWYNQKTVFAILNQPRTARELFPCLDEPELSAIFNITFQHHVSNIFITNMMQEFTEKDYNNTEEIIFTRFHTTSEMSPNDIAIVIYKFKTMNQIYLRKTKIGSNNIFDSVLCRQHLTAHMKVAINVAETLILYLRNEWKIFQIVPKIDIVVLPNFEDKTWRTRGLVIFNEFDVIYDESLDVFAHKHTVMRTIAHSIISQGGYGYIFDISCLSYWWLNEGFVMFLETYILDKAFPDSRMMDLFVVQNQYESRYLTSKDTANCMEYTGDIFKINPVISFSPIKGAVIWRMLEYLAHDVFWKSLHTYVNQTSFNFKTPDDLWYTMEAAARRHKDTFKDLSNLWKVKKAIDIWTKEKCCPVLNVIRNYETREVEISKNLDDKSDKSPYFIPVTFTINTDFNFVANRPNISNYLSEIKPTMKIFLDEKVKWIIVNIQQTGYYRVNYDFKNWQNLASYLNSDEYTNIHVLNRAQIIDDAFYMAINNKLNFCLFWKLVKYLWREKDYIAWYPMFKIFEYISNIYALQYNPVQFSTVIKFQEIVLNISSIFDPLGEHMYGPTVPTNNDFDKCLVQERSKWACFFDHPLCIKAAENQLKLYLNNSEKNTFLPDWRKWILCNGLKTANNSLWDHVSKVLKKAVSMKRENAAVFELLSCFKDHLIIQNYLSVTQTLLYENIIMKDIPIDEKMIKENNKMYALITNMYLSALSRHAKTTKGLEELLKNFEKMRPIHISTNAAMTVIINSALSSRQISTANVSEIKQNAK